MVPLKIRVALIAGVVALPMGFAAGSVLADNEAEDTSAASALAKAERREGLTKVWLAIKAQNAQDSPEFATVDAELQRLGGPDPTVPPVDGPDNAFERQLQNEIDEGGTYGDGD